MTPQEWAAYYQAATARILAAIHEPPATYTEVVEPPVRDETCDAYETEARARNDLPGGTWR